MIEIFTLISQYYVFDFMCGWYNIKIFVEKRVLFYYEKSKVYSKETRKRTGLNMLGCHSAEAVMVGDRMDYEESVAEIWFSSTYNSWLLRYAWLCDNERRIPYFSIHLSLLWDIEILKI